MIRNLILIIIVLLFALSACNPPATPTDDPVPPTEDSVEQENEASEPYI